MNAQHEKFVQEMIAHGDKKRAYLSAYPRCKPGNAANAASRLASRPEIAEKLEKSSNRVLKKVEATVSADITEKLETMSGMRAILSDMVSGKMKFDKPYRTKDGCEVKEVKAGAREVLKAIELNMKIIKETPTGPGTKGFTIIIGDKPFK